ncbi:toxin [Listeria monocytogenes]|nr:toxin [Listeria monocytogenes]ECC0876468.1 toxin [Listeria monocytogenes]ECK6821631.1 toxin [Listeria monocytogenes]EJB8834755.1 toxin [Listeria monocytogenes]
MNALETMMDSISKQIPILECDLYKNTNRYGIYADGHILLERHMNSRNKKVILIEEYLHSKHTEGNILDETDINNKKQENFVRRKNYELLFSSECIIRAYNLGFTYYHDVADYFDLPETFIRDAIKHYEQLYGEMWEVGEYIIFLGNYIEVFKKDTLKNIYD